MARKKVSATPQTAASRSTAAIFNNVSSPEQLDQPLEPVEEKPILDYTNEDPAENARFPLSLIYEFQDFLNAHMTLAKGVQTLVCLYICQVMYFYLQKSDNDEVLSAVAFNIGGAVVAMYLSHRSATKNHKENPELVPAPKLPPFNCLYGLLIPYLFVLLLSDPTAPFFQVNLSLTNFAIPSLHPIAKVLSAFVYNFTFASQHTLDLMQFGQVIWIYLSVDYALTMWNEDGERKTMDPAEIHIVAVFLANLLVNFTLPVVDANAPMLIARVLAIALIIACGASFPLYYLYKLMLAGAARSAFSLLVVSAFAGSFYFVTNYLFQSHVAKREVLLWLYAYISASELRTKLLVSWASALVAIAPVLYFLSAKNILSLNNRRKVWHFALAGSLAYPALIEESTFTALAALGSVFVFIVLEFLRCTRITFLGRLVHNAMHMFQDEKDLKGPLSLSYIFLLLGAAIPIGYGVVVGDVVSMRSYIGLVTLGLGDSFASIVGRRFGKIKWRNSSRTMEGTLTYIIVTFASFVAIDHYLLPEASKVKNWENVFIVALISGILEGVASLNDNVLIPCMGVIVYELLGKVFP